MEKLPWWEVAIVVGAVGVASGAFIIACGAFTAGTGGTGALPCVLAGIALIGAMAKWILAIGSGSDEANAIEAKAEQLDELAQELRAEG